MRSKFSMALAAVKLHCGAVLLAFCLFGANADAQTTQRARPAAWDSLVFGGRFMDRFLPMPDKGKLTSDTWGGDNVKPRFVDNGIENSSWSFWGGNITRTDDGQYNLFVCGWPESSPRGHFTWPHSTIFHAVSDTLSGPYVVKDTLGPGHNPEVFKLKDGRYVVYFINGYYIAGGVNGPWTRDTFQFNRRDRNIMDGLSNLTFARREDGSYLMVNRGGGVWYSQTGVSPWNQVTEKRLYPSFKGNFEDPVVWRSPNQYNVIVNDWLGRIAYYMRSKDGVNWKLESGEAYMPGITRHRDGTVENWFKYERMKIFQDQYGRPIQANFAVIDVEKNLDRASDNHSSKNVDIPLMPERLITLLNKDPINAGTKTVRLKIKGEKDIDFGDIDLGSLRFGASEEVNYGHGGKVLKTERSGKDLIITFGIDGDKITDDDYAAKLLGKTKGGKLVFGYALLPGVSQDDPILSALLPLITPDDKGFELKVNVENFGQVASKGDSLQLAYAKDSQQVVIGTVRIPPGIKPFEAIDAVFQCGNLFDKGVAYDFTVTIDPANKNPVTLHGKLTPVNSGFCLDERCRPDQTLFSPYRTMAA